MKLFATLNEDFQLPIPKEAAAAAGWRPGQRFALSLIGRHVLLEAVAEGQPGPLGDVDTECQRIAADKSSRALTVEDLRGTMKGVDAEGLRDRDDRY